jgi:hypothetical protein
MDNKRKEQEKKEKEMKKNSHGSAHDKNKGMSDKPKK